MMSRRATRLVNEQTSVVPGRIDGRVRATYPFWMVVAEVEVATNLLSYLVELGMADAPVLGASAEFLAAVVSCLLTFDTSMFE